MSAIWGMLKKHRRMEEMESARKQMTEIYEKRCKLDRIAYQMEAEGFFCCGLQYITQEAKQERLPIYEKEKQVYITADCILDNRAELCEWLSLGKEQADGEILYHAYLAEGITFLKRLRGMYAIAIYDQSQEICYLAVDQLSQRCLYYHTEGETITFSTLIDPILSVYKDCEKNEWYYKDFLIAPGMMPNVVPGETPYKESYQVTPGSYIRFQKGKVSEHIYWSMEECGKKTKKMSAKQCAAEFLETYQACVASALRTDKEVSICLSSGLDSASVAALAAMQLKEQNKKLYSYTYVPYMKPPKNRKQYFVEDETALVKELVQKYENMEPHFLCNQGKNFLEDFDKMREIMEIPFKAAVNLPNLFEIYNEAYCNNSRIVLNGQYGNSTVSYGYMEPILYDLHKRGKCVTYMKYLNGYCTKTVKQSRKQAWKEMKGYFRYADEKRENNKKLQPRVTHPFVTDAILKEYPYEKRFEEVRDILLQEDIPDTSEMRRKKMSLMASFLYIGAYETKLGLAAGVVVRDPTRDLRMIQFCNEMPYEYFAYKGCVRWLIRGVMKDYLPEQYVNVWPRYGLQNADWHLRVLRDWKQVRPRFAAILDKKEEQPYLNCAKIQDFLKTIDACYAEENMEEITWEDELQYLSFLL